jgi:uncharacterized cupin superfamily protein
MNFWQTYVRQPSFSPHISKPVHLSLALQGTAHKRARLAARRGLWAASDACLRIKIEKPSAETISEMQRCPTWSKEASVFDWEYNATETCYVLEGDVKVTMPEGEAVEFGAGDLVTFPPG